MNLSCVISYPDCGFSSLSPSKWQYSTLKQATTTFFLILTCCILTIHDHILTSFNILQSNDLRPANNLRIMGNQAHKLKNHTETVQSRYIACLGKPVLPSTLLTTNYTNQQATSLQSKCLLQIKSPNMIRISKREIRTTRDNGRRRTTVKMLDPAIMRKRAACLLNLRCVNPVQKEGTDDILHYALMSLSFLSPSFLLLPVHPPPPPPFWNQSSIRTLFRGRHQE